MRAGAAPGTTPGAGDVSRLREAIASTPLDPDVRAQVLSALADIGDAPVAVRSSGTAEDLPGASFAGQHGTYFAGDADGCATSRHGLLGLCGPTAHTHTAYDRALSTTSSRWPCSSSGRPAEAAVSRSLPIRSRGRRWWSIVWGFGEMLVSDRVARTTGVLGAGPHGAETGAGTKPVALLTRPTAG